MGIEVTPCASLEEVTGAFTPIWHYFGGRPTPEDVERFARLLPMDRVHAARENGKIIGGASSFPFEMTTPGGSVRAAGTTVVGVLPTHRRRGVLRAMMRAQLDAIHARQEPVAYLWASEETIYGRFGYGMASVSCDFDLPKSHGEFVQRFEPRGELRMLEEEEALAPFSEIYERVRPLHPGMFARSDEWWRLRKLNDPEARRAGGGPLNRVLLTLDGKPEAYALYRLHQTLELGISSGHVSVIEAIGTSPEATREIWRFLLDIDWTARVKAQLLPFDHPLFLLLARPRMMRMRVADALWVRLVDVQAALAARSYAPGEPVVLEVADEFCPWNAGRYRVSRDGAERTSAEADLSLDVTALGSMYLGGFSAQRLAQAGRVAELREGGLTRATNIFASDRAPWCPEIF